MMVGNFWKHWLHSGPREIPAVPAANMNEIRLLILGVVADCTSKAAERMREQVRSMRSGSDLLLLRGDLYQLVAREHCETEARRRINNLLPALKAWVPAHTLARV